ncbi:MAG TPA: HD domain-containing phosphohydrolase [Rectinemataceae bacterium]|nr:HD domain-containing phosphohydrolase [Rectinemataceae bacterium]
MKTMHDTKGESGGRPRILIVDDSPENILLLIEILKTEYEIIVATSGEQALKRLEASPCLDLILLDVVLPGLNGFEVCAMLKTKRATRSIPVIFLSALDTEANESRGLEVGGVDYITKPYSPSIVRARIRSHLELKRHRNRLEDLVLERTEELTLTQAVTFMSLGTLAEFRDPETGGHIQRTANYVRLLCQRLSRSDDFCAVLTPPMIERLAQSAPLHDIGKVGIPDTILLKEGPLSAKEFEIMKTHAELGYRALMQSTLMLGGNSFLNIAMDVALSHHERWNGEGYPRRFAEEETPLAGRIMKLADVYDALTTRRPYKPPFSHENSKAIMCEEMNEHFDPRILRAFLELEDEFKAVASKYQDAEEPAGCEDTRRFREQTDRVLPC